MKKYISIFLILSLFSFSQERNWQGSAVKGDSSLFKHDVGLIALSNVLQMGKEYLVKNFTDGKTVLVKIVGALKEPGLLLMLSPNASNEIGIKGYLPMQVQVVESSLINKFDLDKEISASPEDDENVAVEESVISPSSVNPDVDKEITIDKSEPTMASNKKISLIPAEFREPPKTLSQDDMHIVESVSPDKYYIQCASFTNLASLYSAKEIFETNKSSVLVLKSIVSGKLVYRLLLGPYQDKNSAINMLDVAKKLGYGDSYVRYGTNLSK